MGLQKTIRVIENFNGMLGNGKTSFLRRPFVSAPKINPLQIRYIPNPNLLRSTETAGQKVSTLSRKTEILGKYCQANKLPQKEVLQRFNSLETYLDDISMERLLKLTEEGKIKLFERPRIRLSLKKEATTQFIRDDAVAILNHFNTERMQLEHVANNGKALKELLFLEQQGKINPEHITNILTLGAKPKQLNALIEGLHTGKIIGTNAKELNQAMILCAHDFSLELLTAKNLETLSKEELKQLRRILATKGSNRNATKAAKEQAVRDALCELDTPIMPKSKEARTLLLKDISKRLSKLTQVNKVSPEISKRFTANFANIERAFQNTTHSIEDLTKMGGIQLQYSREAFKEVLLGRISHLPRAEQNKILNKFGLNLGNNSILSGLPTYLTETKGLSQTEIAINEEINKFLFQNKIILPKGFEGYQQSLEEITNVFPEFLFTIGLKQHETHKFQLAEHILKVFEGNVRNPLYKTLNETDRRVLGISTLLHDINKVEKTEDVIHALISSQSTNAIMERFGHLSLAEKDRIINLVENHHWLEKISLEEEALTSAVVGDLAYTFRSGNDFTLAKIFAESDLKGVNPNFFKAFGSKINSPMTNAIEQRILQLQSKGRPIYTADITLEEALKAGGELRVIGEGAQQTRNVVVKASQLGLDSTPVLYHAPATDDAFIMMESGLGYGKEGVFSVTLGKNHNSAVFQKRPEFMIFRRPNADNICYTSPTNGNVGAEKGYDLFRSFFETNEHFALNARREYNALTGKEIDETTYARLYRSIANTAPETIHTNPAVKQILGGENEAIAFEQAIARTQNSLMSGTKETTNISELVIADAHAGGIGTNRTAEEVSYEVRKMSENKYPIVEFD